MVHYAINSTLYINTLKEKYNKKYEKLVHRIEMYAGAIRILSKGYLPISLLPPMRLKEISDYAKKDIQITDPDYDNVMKGLHLYYDMKLVTFDSNSERNLIVQFPIFIQPYVQQYLILYQVETVPVPIIDLNKKAQSFTHLQVNKSYIALNSETYISLRKQECVRILVMHFIVKHFLQSSTNLNTAVRVLFILI